MDAPLNVLGGKKDPHAEAGEQGPRGVPCIVVQATPALAGSFSTVGVKSWVIFTGMMAEAGETETPIARTVTVTDPDRLESDSDFAVIITGRFAAGGVDGAV